MTSEIKFAIPGDPVSKGRPRMTRTGHVYTPAKTERWESFARLCASTAMCGNAPLSGPVSVTVTAVLRVPESWSRKKREAAEAGTLLPQAKPDVDNLAKAALDALTGVVVLDDKQVVELFVAKVYARAGEGPMVRVAVREHREGGLT
jgi:Holliday junction resolvase RusA-like endonuclease